MRKILVSTVMLSGMLLSGAGMAADAAAGKARYGMCAGCHGANGGGNAALKYPKLTGQSADAIASKLADYKSGKLNNATMKAMAAGLSDADMANIGAYVATLK